MAPSNLNQVFISNTGVTLTGSTFLSNPTLPNTTIGVWRVPTSGSGAYLTALTAPNGITEVSGLIQIVQTTRSGNSFASPLINPKNIKRIAYSTYQQPIRHSVDATFSTAVPAKQSYMFKIAIRNYPTIYEAFANPTNPDLDLSGGNKTFPLLGNFSTGRTVIPVVEITDTVGTSAALCASEVVGAIQGNKILNDLFEASAAAGVVTITARHIGVVFDVACNNTATNSPAIISAINTGADEGVGASVLALSDEKSQRARYGNFNRMYFPMPFDTFTQSGTLYDVVEISYAHDWPSSTGIARAGELNNIKIYYKRTTGATVGNDADVMFLAGDSTNWWNGTAATNTDLRF